MCALCHTEHWLREPHSFGKSVVATPDRHGATQALKARIMELETELAERDAQIAELQRVKLVETVSKTSVKPANIATVSKPDRREYMRNLMREKRAKAKAAKQ